jgi:antitoxin component YwqK of YwqJK toxin-antitoxin module
MIVTLKAGERNGAATTWLPNGKVYSQMTYELAVPVGDMLTINPKTGELVKTATFDQGRKVVTKTDYYPRGKQKKLEIMLLAAKTTLQTSDDFWTTKLAKYAAEGADMKHGSSKAWYANGQPKEDGFYTNDQKSGTFTFWHENGQVAATGEYRDDLAEGNWVWWYDNGQKSAVGKYENGKLVGDWRWWDEEGKLTKHKTYDGAESVSTETEERYDVSKRSTRTSRR